MRPYQLATAAAIIIVAAVAMVDSRNWALIQDRSTSPGGMGPGFYPFWSAMLMAVAALVVVERTLRTPQPAEGPFGREGLRAVLLLVAPMAVAVLAMEWLGFYVVGALYLAFFTRVLGSYRWPAVLAVALVITVSLYAVFELGFRVPLPKSDLYERGVLPF